MNNNETQGGLHKSVINWYPGHMAKTKRLIRENLNVIDIVYEILDARIPYSSKIKDLDDFIHQKPRILILTKMDLCDKKETQKWITFYEQQGYTVIGVDLEHPFNPSVLLKSTEKMMEEKNASRERQGMLKKKVKVLIVGIPNVGKSTLINRLVGKKAVNVGNKPGVTKNLDWIRINEQIELLDSPGVLWPKLDNEKVALNLASLTAIKEEVLPLYDVVFYILKMLESYYPEKLKERYKIDKVEEDFIATLETIGKKRGALIKGGEVDYDKVVTLVLNDIKSGLISGITFDRFEENHDK